MSFWKNISEFTKEVIAPALDSSDDEEEGQEVSQRESTPMHHEASTVDHVQNGWIGEDAAVESQNLNLGENDTLDQPLVRRQIGSPKQKVTQDAEVDETEESSTEDVPKTDTAPNGGNAESAANAPEEGNEEADLEETAAPPDSTSTNDSSPPNDVASPSITKFLSYLLTESTNPLEDKSQFTSTNPDDNELLDIVLQFIQQYRMLNKLVQTQSQKQKIKMEEYQQLVDHQKVIIQQQQDQINQISHQYQSELQEYSSALQLAQQEKEHLEKSLESYKHKFSQQKRSLSQMSLDAQEEVEFYKQELQQAHEKSDKLNTIIGDLKAQLSKQTQQYTKLEADFDALETGIEDLELEKEREVSELREKLKRIEERSSEMESELATYKERHGETELIRQENESMRAQIQQTQETRQSVEQQNQELVRSLEELLMRVNNDSFVDHGQVTQSLKDYLTHVATENAGEDHFDALANNLRLNQEERNELWQMFNTMLGSRQAVSQSSRWFGGGRKGLLPTHLQGKSLSELWVEFLYNQSQKGKGSNGGGVNGEEGYADSELPPV